MQSQRDSVQRQDSRKGVCHTPLHTDNAVPIPSLLPLALWRGGRGVR
ncbi:MAG: hypothetical protein LBE56_03790 [Tannerella sp.]|nr:hypothetical protein [Tannerella sp.]